MDKNRISSPHQRLINRLSIRGIHNQAVLESIRLIPRHLFVDKALINYAYADHPLPIGHGQTISQPYMVARMTEALLNHASMNKVLEIGTGCGYQTAILAKLIDKVYTVERIKSFSLQARERLKSLGLHNVHFKHSDGQWGWVEHAPYQGIIVTAAPEQIPIPLLHQLTIGGCLIIPVGPSGQQHLLQVIRTYHDYKYYFLDEVNFVPLCKGTL